MNYLRYSSDEMFSSTELIRKSKSIFDKLNNKSIEKAIILRDGKPGFMLLDFATYEKIMKDYEKLKNRVDKKSEEQYLSLDDIEVSSTQEQEISQTIKVAESIADAKPKEIEVNKVEKAVDEPIVQEATKIEDISPEEINEEELLKALDEIDKLSIESDFEVKETKDEELEDDFQIALDEIKEEDKKEQPLKEFWDN